MVMMQAMPFGRFGTVIMCMAEVVPSLHDRAGLAAGCSFGKLGLARRNVVHAPMPEDARGRVRILDDHDVAPRVGGSTSPVQRRGEGFGHPPGIWGGGVGRFGKGAPP